MPFFISIMITILLTYRASALPMEDNAIRIIGSKIQGLLEHNGQGPYNKIFKLTTQGYPAPVVLTVAPIKRATRLLLDGLSDCLYVGSDEIQYYVELGMQQEDILISQGIYTISINIYGPQGSDPIDDVAEVRDQTLAMDMGVGSIEYVAGFMGHPLKNILIAHTLEQGFRMLDKGRVTGLVAVDTDVKYMAAVNPQYRGYSVSDTFSIHQSDDVFVCRRSKSTEAFMAFINKKITHLKEAGVIDNILNNVSIDSKTP